MDIDEFLEKETKNLGNAGPKAKILDTYMTKDINYQNKNIIIEINNIKSLMKENKFGEAGRLYFTVRKKYADLMRQQLEEKHTIYLELSKINQELINYLNQQRLELDKKGGMIKQLIAKGNERLKNAEMNTANQIYLQIREMFRQLPDSFPEKKLLIENEVLQYYSELMKKINSNTRENLLEKSQDINEMITRAFDLVNQKKIEDATKLYNEINKKYNQLPSGFLYERSLLYQKILKLYQATEMVYEKNQVAQQISELPNTQENKQAGPGLTEKSPLKDVPPQTKNNPAHYDDKGKLKIKNM